jgi:hypothetical protein
MTQTYRVVRHTNPAPPQKRATIVEADMLEWEAAKRLRDKLQKEENEKHPERTSWTKDIFCCELEG